MAKNNLQKTNIYSIRTKIALPALILGIISLILLALGALYVQESGYWVFIPLSMANLITLWIFWVLISSNIVRPVKTLSNITQAVEAGDLEQDMDSVSSNDEIGLIASSVSNLAENIKQAQEFTHQIGQGNFETDVAFGNQSNGNGQQNGLFGSLKLMRDRLKNVAENDQKRNWVTKGMAEFTKILSSNDNDLKDLGQRVITNLVRYLDAQQGGLFVINNEAEKERYLELVACYAYDETKFSQRQLVVEEDFAEGLVGQAFLEKDTVYITNVPDQYISIASGLGDSNPHSILIVPLELNGQAEGVIEIASLYSLEQHEIEFVEKLAENIASAILTIKVNDHTKKLLRESRELAQKLQVQEEELRQNYEELQTTQEIVEKKNLLIEEQKEKIEKALQEQTEKSEMLEAQEEEMRQNMEELVATQEQMMITQAELDGQLNAINKSSIFKVEYSLDGKIINANESFCQIMNSTVKKLQQQKHQSFADPEFVASKAYQQFWDGLKAGNAQSGEYKLIGNNGELFWVNAVYSPVINKKAETYKIIQLAFDITEAKELLEETQKQAAILQAQEQELRQSMEELKITQNELNEKNQAIIEFKEEEAEKAQLKAREIESKNQLITASIQYAQNIQRAILPSEDVIKQYVQDMFVIYLPKDIVSGDFYWFSHLDGKTFLAAVDCTGHGVPGAFMSIIGNTLLNEIVNVQKILDPNKILELLHQGVRTKLRQNESSNYDGMDLVICRLETLSSEKVKLVFAGAKRPLFYYHKEQLGELKGDRKSIGGWQKEVHRTFTQQALILDRGDYLYLTTDGLTDNPNPKRKKFGVKRLKSLFTDNTQRPLREVKLRILGDLVTHQDQAEQRDDITVLGIKL